MSNCVELIKQELNKLSNREKGDFLQGFFKANPGGYAEDDILIGITVPEQRKIARNFYREIELSGIVKLLHDPIHEYRLTALFLLINKYEKAKTETEKSELYQLYVDNMAGVNNWDLVDASAYKIMGDFLLNRDRGILYELTRSNDLWKQRIAMIATFQFIRHKQYEDTLKIAEILLHHKHDLIHKAVGWMLREMGKRDFATEERFLRRFYKEMPRTMLRYAIEKFPEELRQDFLKGRI
jgi:3-methyladenine DNA glycosylase AlkD